MSNEKAMVVASETAMAHAGDFGPEHRAVVKDAYCAGASDVEFEILWRGAVSRGLDPVKKQIHFVSRWDEAKNKNVWSSQVSIDGFRAIAERTGEYEGQDEPTYQRDPEEGYLIARVTVYRKGRRPSVGVARWPEFAQMKGTNPTYMWKKMPYHMLAKCAEALALRKAFPEDLSGLYTPEEMGAEVVTAAEKAEAITVATDEDVAAKVEEFRVACLGAAERKDSEGYRATVEAFRSWCEANGVPAERYRTEVQAVKMAVAKAVGVKGDTETPAAA
jgi:phage recombination protein Bet